MKAVLVKEFGSKEVLQVVEDAPTPPLPGKGEVLIRVKAAGKSLRPTWM